MLLKICNHCGKKIKQGETCTCRHRLYDESCRNKAKSRLYHSTMWNKVRQSVKARANGLDEYALRYGQRLLKGNLVHHIFELNERPDLKLSLDNLVFVSSQTHNMIHAAYDKGDEEKRKMRQRLLDIRHVGAVQKVSNK